MSWIAFFYVFLLAHVKFLVTATIALATYPQPVSYTHLRAHET